MSEVIIRPGAQPASGRVTPATFPFYTTGEDDLRIVSWNSAPGVQLSIHARTIDQRGVVSPDSWDHTPNTDRSAKTTDITLSGSTILNLTVFARAGAPLMGQTFVSVQLVRGMGAAAIVLGTLLQGYVTNQQALAWPGSPLQQSTDGSGAVRTIAGTIPAAGGEILETVPTGARWELMSFNCGLTPGVLFAKRIPILKAASPALLIFELVASDGIDAPNSLRFSWTSGIGVTGLVSGARLQQSLPVAFPLLSGAVIATNTLNLDASDQYTFLHYTVREWLEVP